MDDEEVTALARSDGDYERGIGASFMRRPTIDRDDIVLPDGVLERIERRTLEFDAHAAELIVRGQARKRGLLLYGPPGTGKTMTARYLIGSLRQRTTIVLTGIALGSIGAAANLARRLQPALLVLEDVDLVAAERTFDHDNPLLFELLNQLDGLGDDADVLALLTTNRVDVLEPALAARPGRVDLAVELPLPDHVGFRRLLDRYTAHVEVEMDDWSRVIPRLVNRRRDRCRRRQRRDLRDRDRRPVGRDAGGWADPARCRRHLQPRAERHRRAVFWALARRGDPTRLWRIVVAVVTVASFVTPFSLRDAPTTTLVGLLTMHIVAGLAAMSSRPPWPRDSRPDGQRAAATPGRRADQRPSQRYSVGSSTTDQSSAPPSMTNSAPVLQVASAARNSTSFGTLLGL